MKYLKLNRKWFLPIFILILLVVIIYFLFFYFIRTKEGLGSCKKFNTGDFHNPINYSKFEGLSKSNRGTYGNSFSALNKYIKDLSINDIKKRSDKFQLSKNKYWLKWILKSGATILYKINDKTLKSMSKCDKDSFTTLTEGMIGLDAEDKITLTPQDFMDFSNNNLFNIGNDDNYYKDIADPDNCYSIYSIVYGAENCNTNMSMIKFAYDILNSKKNVARVCTSENPPPEYITALSNDPISGGTITLENIKNYKDITIATINYLLDKRLKPDNPDDPYFNFETKHENSTLLFKNIMDILNEKNKKNLYFWMEPSKPK